MRPHVAHNRIRVAIALGAAVALCLIVVAAPAFIHVDPNVTDLSHAYAMPGTEGFALGSDSVGRDVLMRTLFGGRESVLMAFAIVAASMSLGTIVGLAAGFAGGSVDAVLDKVITTFQAFPSFVLATAIAAILGQGSLNMVVAVVAVKWTEFARLARTLAASLKNSDVIAAARLCGAGPLAIAHTYILPAMLPSLGIMATLSLGDAVLTMAGLSFLGLGPGRPTNEWGAMMSEQRSAFQFAPWCIVVPGMALFVSVTVFNLLGDALRDTYDARSATSGDSDSPESDIHRRRTAQTEEAL